MTSQLDQALNAACVLLTEDHSLLECLTAIQRKRHWFRPEDDFSLDPMIVADHMDAVELEATSAATLCSDAGLTALAGVCTQIANRVALAKRMGAGDRSALSDLQRITSDGRIKLDASCDIASEYSRL